MGWDGDKMDRSAKSVLWLLWCLAWAAVWFVLGFRTLGITWTLTVLSLGAACLPVNVVLMALPRPRPHRARVPRARKVSGLRS
jgi:hypothetical protein